MGRSNHRAGEGDQPDGAAGHPHESSSKAGAAEVDDPDTHILSTWPDRLLGGIVAALLGGVVVTVLFQVVMRYVFNSPPDWTTELSSYLLVWLTFIGAGLAYRLQAHIVVDVLVEYLSQRVGRGLMYLLRGVIQGAILIFLIALLIGGVNLVQATSYQTTPGLGISVAWVYLAVPIGSIIMLLSAISQGIGVWRRGRSDRERNEQ